MSTINANISINNMPQLDRVHNDAIKAPAVDLVQSERMDRDETVKNMKRPVEIKNTSIVINKEKQKNQKIIKKKQHQNNDPGYKRKEKKNFSGESGLSVDVEC